MVGKADRPGESDRHAAGNPRRRSGRILVGGAEYYADIDPRVPAEDLKIGTQILVNEAYAVIKTLGYDRNGPVLKVAEALPDGRIRLSKTWAARR